MLVATNPISLMDSGLSVDTRRSKSPRSPRVSGSTLELPLQSCIPGTLTFFNHRLRVALYVKGCKLINARGGTQASQAMVFSGLTPISTQGCLSVFLLYFVLETTACIPVIVLGPTYRVYTSRSPRRVPKRNHLLYLVLALANLVSLRQWSVQGVSCIIHLRPDSCTRIFRGTAACRPDSK